MLTARTLLIAGACAAAYGFAIGSGKNLTYAWRSAVKFPLLLSGTAALCAPAWFVLARFCGARLRFADVATAAADLFTSLAGLLASLAPVVVFLARTMDAPDDRDLAGYPAFVATNAAFVATAGAIAVVHQSRRLLHVHAVGERRAVGVTAAWIGVALAVGGQFAFWLRPFFGVATRAGDPPFVLGDEPTSTGARNFYEAMWQFATARDLRDGPR